MRKINCLLGLALLAMTLWVIGCNTVKGVGKDIHDSAQNIQTAIEGSNENYEYVGDNKSARARP